MENNQQRNNANAPGKEELGSFNNRKPGQQLPENNETANKNRFAETSVNNEQHSESSKPDAESQTLGTP